ncbi:conserved hypothetical protein [Desulforapulum autotrophicum HRM2]|uniref:DUF4019 domain-containing protein n=1 Tax=Desulforapulum autotrophicum (strain ATCC 43914 / DSM 3382 / VKM B-1955 / HRM2) TaxID=177437 RepID=C0QD17_DESAH|nr:DUF4019 domain-containing protein [Desulforapulum autotrophicum]ACN17249.1 conserved hypothetical protein [Desulforapulum autotrophicum HRM2]
MVLKRICLFVLLGLIAAQPLGADQSKEVEATAAARSWLLLVDDQSYTDSWERADPYFKNAVTLDQWKKSLLLVRKPLGAVLSRKLISRQYLRSLPGAPDGEYVVIQYGTRFENGGASVETITGLLDPDGVWRVAGYYIKPGG